MQTVRFCTTGTFRQYIMMKIPTRRYNKTTQHIRASPTPKPQYLALHLNKENLLVSVSKNKAIFCFQISDDISGKPSADSSSLISNLIILPSSTFLYFVVFRLLFSFAWSPSSSSSLTLLQLLSLFVWPPPTSSYLTSLGLPSSFLWLSSTLSSFASVGVFSSSFFFFGTGSLWGYYQEWMSS